MAATYHFRAVASDGKVRTGAINAESDRFVARELRRQGLTPVYVGLEPKGPASASLKLPQFSGRRRKDVLFFTQELSTLLNAGVPVDRALSITAELTERPQFKAVVQDVIRVLKGGKSLADSLAGHPDHFSDLYINMVRAGEASGSLATVFERLSEFERTRDDLRNFLIGSLIYPALLAIAGTASILVLLTFVVPRFATIFEDGRIPMPLPMRILIETSNLTRTYAPWVLGGLVAGAVLFRMYVRTSEGRLWWDGFRLKVPLLGTALRRAEVSRFARAMATLVANSVPLVQSLGIAGATMNNRRMSQSLDSVSQGVKRGEGVAGPLKKTGEFPPLASHLLSVGEETGRLDAMFARMADIYDGETRAAVKRFTTLFEPVIILVLGVLIGALILSLLMAITSINDLAM